MSKEIKILQSNSTDPWFNLATEDWIFQEMGECDHILFLWQNQPSVVIGRSQNPWLECNLAQMQQDQVRLARRQSGGGAVFHDLGNMNFTFLSRVPHYQKRDNFEIIRRALQHFNISASVSGRNDLTVKDSTGEVKKISGSAFRETADRAFHHGTLLIDTALTSLQKYLNPNKKKLLAKGIKSVESRVINLKELNPSVSFYGLAQAIIAEFRAFHGMGEDALPVTQLEVGSLAKLVGLNTYYKKMQAWEWLFGQTLHFTHRFEERLSWGMVDIQLEVSAGIIQDARIYSDSLYPEMIERLQKKIIGRKYHPTILSEQLVKLKQDFPSLASEIDELQQWLLIAFA